MSKHHEFNAAMILNVCNSWEKSGGPSKYNFTPVTYFGNEGDKYYDKHSMIVNGKLYYASMGPMQFLIPYYILKLVNANFSVFNLQLVALGIHGILVLLFYLYIKKLVRTKANANGISFWATALFIFLPNFLWFYSNAFCHESLVLVFYLLFLIAIETKNIQTKYCLLAMATFFGLLTDWYQLTVVGIYGIYLLILFFKEKRNEYMLTAFVLLVSSSVAIYIVYFFFAKELGTNNLVYLLKEKFLSRSTNASVEQTSFLGYARKIGVNFLSGYILIAAIALYNLKKIKKYWSEISFKNDKLLLLVVAPILYNGILLEFSTRHDYSNLKYGIVLCILAAILLSARMPIWRKSTKILILLLYVILSSILYYIVNGAYSVQPNTSLMENQNFGIYIANNSKVHNAIFINIKNDNYPALMFYANRNIRVLENKQEVIEHVRKNKILNAIYFEKDNAEYKFEVIK